MTSSVVSQQAVCHKSSSIPQLVVSFAAVAGTLPACWADVGSFPQLTVLGIQSGTKMSGTLPPEWGSPTAFQQLKYLYVVDCPLTGEPTTAPCHRFIKQVCQSSGFPVGASRLEGCCSCCSDAVLSGLFIATIQLQHGNSSFQLSPDCNNFPFCALVHWCHEEA